MARALDTATLDSAARYYAGAFLRPDRADAKGKLIDGPRFVIQQFYNFTFKDEFDHLAQAVKDYMGRKAIEEFDRLAGSTFKPRSEAVLQKLLADKLAIDLDGAHIPGKIGTTKIGARYIRTHPVEVASPEWLRFRKWALANGRDPGPRQTIVKSVPLYWPVYAGEPEERDAGSGVADELPPGADPWPVDLVRALNTCVSNEAAIAACDAIVDRLDEGTGAAILQVRSGAQPADVDTAVSGTLLAQLTCSDPAFGAAADANPGGQATAAAVTADASADATGTAGYCRASATNDGATALDDHIDGEAGASGADFNFNTTSIVSGSEVSLASWTFKVPER